MITNQPKDKTARIAGLIYLATVITGIFSLAYVPSMLFVSGNAVETFKNIQASEMLFRIGMVSEIICYSVFLLLPLALYKLFDGVSKNHALLMVLFVVIAVPLSLQAVTHKFDIVSLFDGSEYLNDLSVDQLQTQAMYHLDSYYNRLRVASVFWGLWLFPFGYLVFKSGFLPRILGIFLMLGSVGYIVEFFGSSLFVNYSESVVSTIAGIPSSIGEIGICLWLLIFGARSSLFKRKADNI